MMGSCHSWMMCVLMVSAGRQSHSQEWKGGCGACVGFVTLVIFGSCSFGDALNWSLWLYRFHVPLEVL